jgi:ribosome recycling factor
MTTIKDIVQNSRVSMEKGVEASKRDFAGIRSTRFAWRCTGRA